MRKTLLSSTAAVVALAPALAFAQTATDPVSTLVNQVNLGGVATAIGGAGAAIIAIALTFKGFGYVKKLIYGA